MSFSVNDGISPEEYALPISKVFEKFSEGVLDSFLDLPTDDAFNACYIPAKKIGSIDRLRHVFDEDVDSLREIEQDALIGEHEIDILYYAFSKKDGPIEFLIVEGPMGCGKSTLVRSVRKLVKDSKYSLRGKVDILAVNSNNKLSEFESSRGNKHEIRNVIMRVIDRRLTYMLSNVLDVNYEQFWEFVNRRSLRFSQVAVAIRAFKASHSDREKSRSYEMAKRAEYVTTEDSLWDAIDFLKERLNRQLVLVFDNLDPLHTDIQREIVRIAKELTTESSLKMIVPMRPETRAILSQTENYLRQRVVKISVPPLKDVLFRRSEYIRRQAEDMLIRERRRPGHAPGEPVPHVASSPEQEMLDRVLKILLSESVLKHCRLLSGDSLRMALKMASAYIASGWLDVYHLSGQIEAAIGAGRSVYIPESIFNYAVITNNHKTYFLIRQSFENVVNVWCDGSLMFPWGHFIALHVLTIVLKSSCTVGGLCDRLDDIYAESRMNFPGQTGDAVRDVLISLINARLLSTPHQLIVTSIDRNDRIRITPLGLHYCREFAFSVDYFGFIKDEIKIESFTGHSPPFKSSCYDLGVADRLFNSVKACEYLLSQERKLMQSFPQDNSGRKENAGRIGECLYRDILMTFDGFKYYPHSHRLALSIRDTIIDQKRLASSVGYSDVVRKTLEEADVQAEKLLRETEKLVAVK